MRKRIYDAPQCNIVVLNTRVGVLEGSQDTSTTISVHMDEIPETETVTSVDGCLYGQ